MIGTVVGTGLHCFADLYSMSFLLSFYKPCDLYLAEGVEAKSLKFLCGHLSPIHVYHSALITSCHFIKRFSLRLGVRSDLVAASFVYL